MFGGNRIKLDKDLVERAKRCAEVAGYSSVEEFVTHIVEREINKLEESGTSEEEIKKQLQGLGYIS
jgi:hypothetical protein